MTSEQYKRDLAQLVKDEAYVRRDIAKAEDDAAKARAEAARKRASAQRASTASMLDMDRRAAEAEDRKLVAAQKRISDLYDKLSSNADRQRQKEQSILNAEKSERDALGRAADSRRRQEKAEQDARDRADARGRQIERDHAREVARLSRPTVHHVFVREPEPEKLRVLYLTASPATSSASPLRVDAEVNNVLKVLRGARYRELIELLHRPAAAMEDLVNGLNDHRPHVVHFSGHAGGGLLFDNASVDAPAEHLVGYRAVAQVLSATDRKPTLVVLNACHTLEGAHEMLQAASTVIAMSDSVLDASAAIFATQFYGALGAAQSIGHAVDQARAMISVALPDEPDLIRVCAAGGVDPYGVQLVISRPLKGCS